MTMAPPLSVGFIVPDWSFGYIFSACLLLSVNVLVFDFLSRDLFVFISFRLSGLLLGCCFDFRSMCNCLVSCCILID